MRSFSCSDSVVGRFPGSESGVVGTPSRSDSVVVGTPSRSDSLVVGISLDPDSVVGTPGPDSAVVGTPSGPVPPLSTSDGFDSVVVVEAAAASAETVNFLAGD